MGTAKRERQKANRQLRLEELAKQARKEKTKKVSLRVVLLIGGVIALVALIYVMGGDDNKSTTSATSTTAGAPTTTLEPIAAPTKPTVTIPTANPTELKVTTLTEGTGAKTQKGDLVRVYYVGVLSKDGTEFDNNYDSGTTLDVVLGSGMVIQGWEQGLLGLQAGGRYQIDIPADLGYGANDVGLIPANSALTFVVDIMKVVPGSTTTTDATTTTGAATTTTG